VKARAGSNPIYLYIGGAILNVGFAILLTKKMGWFIERLESWMENSRWEYWMEKSTHLVIHLGKTLFSGRCNTKLPTLSPIDLVSMDITISVPTATFNNLSAIYNPISALSTRLRKRMGAIWFDTPLDDVFWMHKERHLFRLSTFKRYMKALGLK